MKINGRNSAVRDATIIPQPETIRLGNTRQAWCSSLHRARTDAPPASGRGSPVFELVPIEQLPEFDASKTLKNMLLSPEQIRRLNAFKTRWKSLITIMLQLGNFLMVLTTATPRRPVIAVLASLLQFPGMAFVLASIRINMLRLLLSTYDYWYFTLNNLIFGVCFAAIFRDIRVVTVFMGCVIVQISIGADALVGDRRQLFISSAINCGTHMAMFVAVFLKLVDDKGNGDSFLLSYSSTGYGFSIRDTLMNTQLNIILLFGRLVYRNWVGMREQEVAKARRINSETSYIPGRRRCVSYYCTVGLRPKTGSSPSSVRETVVQAGNASSIPRTDTVGSTARSRPDSVKSVQALDSYRSRLNLLASMRSNSTKGTNALHNARRTHNRSFTKIQLKFVPIEEDFNAYKTLVPGFGRLLDRVLGSSSSRQGRRVVLNVFHALGYVGMGVLVLGALCAWVSKDQNLDNLRPGLARTQKVAFFASLIFCNVFFAAYQRQLLKRLYSSFNFIFLTTKLTVASMALCQFFAWDRRVIWVWGAWIWMQWAITLDALPPSAMRLLAFRRSTLTLSVLAFELTGLIILSLELFVFDRWIVPNRAVVDRVIRGRRIQLSTLSALVTRLWTIFLWDCKLIWFLTASLRRQRHRRLSVSAATKAHDDDEGERLLLTGRVEFFYEWASETPFRPRWSNRLQILRASQAMLRRYTKTAMTREERGLVQVSKPD